jgi:nitrogen regulatory protein PII
MKFNMAIIRPFKLDAARTALVDLDVGGLTVSETRGSGRRCGQTESYRGAEYAGNFQPKIKIEVAVSDERVEQVVEAIQLATNTGPNGDGKIFVLDMDRAVRTRAGETQSVAL